MYRIGVDVGGTNTDAAILDVLAASQPSRGVLASSKTPTTRDVTSGIKTAVEAVLKKSEVDTDKVLSVAIGTTHFVNAVVEADPGRLSRVAVVRLCGPFTRMIPPFADFPQSLRNIIQGPTYYLDGGLEIDGREIRQLDLAQVKVMISEIRAKGINTIALVGIFSPLDHQGLHEERCKALMLEADPSLAVVCSHDIGNIGLLERENATILNASILALAKKTVRAFVTAIEKLQLSCILYLTQNDGTLTDAETAVQFPIKTFASGPTNSMTGAVFLASLDVAGSSLVDKQTVIVDIGGTTTDVCALMPSGFPRQAPTFIEVGGVRTAFSMPEVLSIGLGGGSQVKCEDNNGQVSVGPDSVGYQLPQKALVFGGNVLTATDIVVASGHQEVGDKFFVESVPKEIVSKARLKIKKMLEEVIEDMKVSSLPVVAVMCGGVGAAIAKVVGELDTIEILSGRDEHAVLEDAKQRAIDLAIVRGADPSDVHIAEMDKMPLQYAANKATRIKIKAVGKLRVPEKTDVGNKGYTWEDEKADEPIAFQIIDQANISAIDVKPSRHVDIGTYKPDVRNGAWYLSPIDLEFISVGVGVLGTGGGGSSYLTYLNSLKHLLDSAPGTMRVISPSSLKDSDVCVFGSWYGAPSVSGERLPAGTEIMTSIDYSVKLSPYKEFHATIAVEIGGGNGLSTFPTSAYYNIPVIDGDLMGRAYPTMEHVTPYLYGEPALPCVLADGRGNVGVVMQAESNSRIETMLRTTCVELGIQAASAAIPLTGDVIKKYVVPNTVSQSWYLGRAIHLARRAKVDLIESILAVTPGKLIFSGKIIDVRRDVSCGYTMGSVLIEPEESENTGREGRADARNMIIPFQNEYLYAALVNSRHIQTDMSTEEEIVTTVPDLISILSSANGEAIGSQDLRYGLKVKVLALPAHPLWTDTPKGLAIGGPDFFKLGDHVKWERGRGGLEAYGKGPKSVIEEFNTQG
ncbi:putative hydantoinase oxoprolinase [Phaeomoniella chlamydospora]|uniref:Putative hydantoinase oxoprolinase n=1 Tax=Phaeomoniella chlamydospora TaxID=158046 RepID=A0A0G2E1Q3_PHACM|nr:putative hydantoinase oxoprolinase [Phaeomoniella chlamydospora]